MTDAIAVTSLNVNGIRAAYRRGLEQWLEEVAPDVLLLQEVRAEVDVAQKLLGPNWSSVVVPSQVKGRSGVAVAVRNNSSAVSFAEGDSVQTVLDEEETPEDTGRWVEVHLDTAGGKPLRVVSAYFHSGQKDDPKQDAKMDHLGRIDARMTQLLGEGEEQGIHTLVAGDFNVVRSEADIKNWKGNHNRSSGVLDEEMVFLNRWVSQGWVDTVRELAGAGPGPYSWWSWRGKAFDNDTGWRIDYHYATPGLGGVARDYKIGRAPSWDTRISDHAPVTVWYSL